jgi:hypothetical protein
MNTIINIDTAEENRLKDELLKVVLTDHFLFLI